MKLLLVSLIALLASAAHAGDYYSAPLPAELKFVATYDGQPVGTASAIELRTLNSPLLPAEVTEALDGFQSQVINSSWGERIAKLYFIEKPEFKLPVTDADRPYPDFLKDFSAFYQSKKQCGLQKDSAESIFSSFFWPHTSDLWSAVAKSVSRFFNVLGKTYVGSIEYDSYKCQKLDSTDEDGMPSYSADDRVILTRLPEDKFPKEFLNKYEFAMVVIEYR
jgi:hypothetical protein